MMNQKDPDLASLPIFSFSRVISLATWSMLRSFADYFLTNRLLCLIWSKWYLNLDKINLILFNHSHIPYSIIELGLGGYNPQQFISIKKLFDLFLEFRAQLKI
jgi:hypothetical protein